MVKMRWMSTKMKKVMAAAAEETNIEVSDDDGDTEAEMADENGTPKTPKKKKNKSKKPNPRRSSLNLNMEALTNEQAALAALESNQILHLRLRKRYYAEGLNFIRLVEGAMWVFLSTLLAVLPSPFILR